MNDDEDDPARVGSLAGRDGEDLTRSENEALPLAAKRTEQHAPWCSQIGKPCECELKDWHRPDIRGER